MVPWCRTLLGRLFLIALWSRCVDGETSPKADPQAGTPKFRTEPRFYPETFNFTHFSDDKSLTSPGYIFIAPLAKFFDWGPQIYDLEGNLVFYGDDVAGIQKHVEDFKVCDYLEERGKHLCLHDGEKRGTIGGVNPYGRKVYLDTTYRHVGRNYTFPNKHNHTYPNSHEFQPIDNGNSFLEPVYRPLNTDLRPYLGKKDGWLWDACFWEIDVRTGHATFDWCYLDHYPVWETNLFFTAEGSPNNTSPKAGGGDWAWPWDPLHMNAIDKDAEGDYLVSIRHLDQILRIAGNNNSQGLEPGATIWRLGGKSNDFDMGSLSFSKQHSVRFLSQDGDEETFSLFDNAWEGTNEPTADLSAGKIVTVNNATMQARSVIEYAHPYGMLAESQGNMQNLPNDNVFIGWGFKPQMTEFLANGTALWHASFTKDDERAGFSYRAFKDEWVAQPYWPPKVLAYAPSCKTSRASPLIAYVSHNGATEVKSWRFSTATRSAGPWISAGTFAKQGFETRVVLSGRLNSALSPFMPHVWVEALDAHGRVLDGVKTRTFVPTVAVRERHACNADGCPLGFDYLAEYDRAEACRTSQMPNGVALAFALLILEVSTYAANALVAASLLADTARRSVRGGRGVRKARGIIVANRLGDHRA